MIAARPLRSDACSRALRCHRDCRCSCPPRPLPLLLRRLVPPALLLPRRLPAPPRLRQVIPYPPRRCPERAPAPAPVPRRAPWQPRARRSTALHHAARPASHLPLNAVQRSRRRCCLSPPPPPSPLNLPRRLSQCASIAAPAPAASSSSSTAALWEQPSVLRLYPVVLHVQQQATPLPLLSPPPLAVTAVTCTRQELRQLLSFAPKNLPIMRRAVNAKRVATAAAADADDRRQMVADTLQQLQLREQRVQDVERCASASYIFVMDLLQARRPPLPALSACV